MYTRPNFTKGDGLRTWTRCDQARATRARQLRIAEDSARRAETEAMLAEWGAYPAILSAGGLYRSPDPDEREAACAAAAAALDLLHAAREALRRAWLAEADAAGA